MADAAELISAVDAALVGRVLAMNPAVRRLNLSHNAVAAVGEDVTRLGGTLESLDLSGNRLASLPPPLARLPRLASLYAADNVM
jgi:Leucine-rich repeat (LRR) protein